MLGFSTKDVVKMFTYYKEKGSIPADSDVEAIVNDMKPWYDNYCFAKESYGKTTMYNSNMVLYFMDKYLNNGKPLNARNRHEGSQRPLSPRELAKSVKEQLKADKGSGFFKDKKKKSFNPNFDNDNHNRKNRYNSGDKNERGGRGNQGRGNQGRNEGRGRRR